ncbi:MAG: methionine--tRNA ligase [Candidatus Atribacteria bacterium]|nr:methionine--tRNA ligase [Candidatus Atribacteria bacterium]
MEKSFYITTPIYYVNDVPHIGHAYTTCAADILARFHRLLGERVLFSTGTDEHGQKIEKAAQEAGLSPQELVDKVVVRFQELWKTMHIEHDVFIRTTSEEHEKVVQDFFLLLQRKGYIYKGEYEGWYCVPCETFWPESQLDERLVCPDCGRPLQKLKEESYFFALSRFTEPLLRYLEEHPDFVMPESRYNEIYSFVRGGLKDQSISRAGLKWGIQVPGDPDHTFYVWFDALINYITVAGFGRDEAQFSTFWPWAYHLVGKDILRFHAVLWPGMLLGAELPLPRRIFAHGWWTVEGEKMSKSKGNVVDPYRMIAQYGVDRFRYFLMREVSFGLDGDFSEKALVERSNADLSDNFGNMVHRTLNMVFKYRDGVVKKPGAYEDLEWEELLQDVKEKFFLSMERFAFAQALENVWRLIHFANRYIDQKAPWRMFKEGNEDLDQVLYRLLDCSRIVAVFISPFMPSTAAKLWSLIGMGEQFEFSPKIAELEWGRGPEHYRVKHPEPLFPRLT